MKLKIPAVLLIFTLYLFFPLIAYALTLDNIGNLSTDGQVYNEWWYSGTNPTLSGTADPNSTVTVTVNEDTATTTADESGLWSYTSTNMPEGDYNITLASGGETMSFILHVGQAYPGTTETVVSEESGAPVPETGFSQILGIMLSIAAFLTAVVVYYYNRSTVIPAFEKKVIKRL
jgi:hypothetical protein